jgi:hypothetical protein
MAILIDPEDAWLLDILPWRVTPKGYVEATMYDGEWRKTVKLHHFIMGTPISEEEIVDHENRNKLDNRKINLRWVDLYTSSQNRDYVDYASNIRPTYSGKFEVRIQRDGVCHQVGTFNTEEEAADARDAWLEAYEHQPETNN